MANLRIPTLILVAALAAGAAGFYGQQWASTHVQGPHRFPGSVHDGSAEMERVTAVTALGRLEPESKIIDVGMPASSRIERLAVKEGDSVQRGIPLAYLDSYAEMAAARDHAQKQLEEAKIRMQAETTHGQAVIEETRLRLKQAVEVAQLGIQAQEAEVSRTQAILEKAQLDCQRSRQMLEDRAIPQSQLDSTTLGLREAEAQLRRNRHTLAQLQHDRDVKIQMAHQELKSAEANLTRAQVAAQVESLIVGVKLAEARLERTIVRSPVAGEILKVLMQPGESAGKGPILKMGNTRSMCAMAEIYETDVRHVRPGQTATITSRAFPGQKLTGRVEHVGALVHKNDLLRIEPASSTDTRIIEALIRLDDSRLAARYNYLQVDVSIRVELPGDAP